MRSRANGDGKRLLRHARSALPKVLTKGAPSATRLAGPGLEANATILGVVVVKGGGVETCALEHRLISAPWLPVMSGSILLCHTRTPLRLPVSACVPFA